MEAVCRCDHAMTTGFVLGMCAFKMIESLAVKFYSNLEDDLDAKLREEIRVEFELQETIEKTAEQERITALKKAAEQERTLTVEKVQALEELRQEIETPKIHFLPPSGNSKYASLASISQDVEERDLKRKKFAESLPPPVNPNLSNYRPYKNDAILRGPDPLFEYQFEGNLMAQENLPKDKFLYDSDEESRKKEYISPRDLQASFI